MIEETSRPGASRVHRSGYRAPVDGLFVKRPVQAPPDQFEDLFEVRGHSRRRGHPARESRVEMSMRANHPRDDQLAPKVDHLLTLLRFKLGATLDDFARVNSQIGALDRRWIEGYERCVFEKV
jgi:hypothetical protein